ncbi:MAG TPA: YceD family protein [Acetobacteraceae bacterium]|nr:YceD family protein [Acetobacteraceae bacterium]
MASEMKPELSRLLAVTDIPPTGRMVRIEANEAERAALARRFRLPAVETLACDFTLRREIKGEIAAAGDLTARVVQVCVVTAEEFSAPVEERFSVRFVPAGQESEDFDPDASDEIPYEGGTLDLGEAAAEQLALALDPWPRKPELGEQPKGV